MIVLPKLVVLVLLVLAVWYGLRWFNAVSGGPPRRRAPGPRVSPSQPAIAVEDLSACPVCRAYVASGAGSCGRAGCPLTPL